MRLSLHTRHRSVLIATGDDARELDEPDDELTDAVVGNGASGDLAVSEDGAPAESTRARRGRQIAVGFA